jgi:hypothetical protein
MTYSCFSAFATHSILMDIPEHPTGSQDAIAIQRKRLHLLWTLGTDEAQLHDAVSSMSDERRPCPRHFMLSMRRVQTVHCISSPARNLQH